MVCDIVGRSTEFVLGAASGMQAERSVDEGCGRLTERHLHYVAGTSRLVAARPDDIDAAVALAGETVPFADARTLVGLAGSVTTVAALALGLARYDAERIHHARISAADVAKVTASLLAMPRSERAALPVMH